MTRMNQRYPEELKDRAVRLVAEVREQHDSEWAAMGSVARKLGIGSAETLRKWVREAEAAPVGGRPKRVQEESAEVRKLRAENKELRRANEILRAAAGLFAAELDRPQR